MFPRQHAELHRLEVRPSMKDPECGRPTAERLKVNFSHCYRNCAWEGGREGLVLRIPQSQGQMKSIHSSFMKCQASWFQQEIDANHVDGSTSYMSRDSAQHGAEK